MSDLTGKIIVDAWRGRGSDEADLEFILDQVLASVYAQREAFRTHVDVEYAAKLKLTQARQKVARAEALEATDLEEPPPKTPLLPIAEIDEVAPLEELIQK